MRKRRRFTPEFKARVVLDVLTGRTTPAGARRTHRLGPARLASRRATFLERAAAAFRGDERQADDRARIAELEPMVGRLTMEAEVLKKASTLLDGTSTANGRRP